MGNLKFRITTHSPVLSSILQSASIFSSHSAPHSPRHQVWWVRWPVTYQEGWYLTRGKQDFDSSVCVCLSMCELVRWLQCIRSKQDLKGGGEQMGNLMMRFLGDWYHIKVKKKKVPVCVCGCALMDSILKRWRRQTESVVGWLYRRWLQLCGNSWSDKRRHPSGQLWSVH